ncbi:hypothetical protein [Roseiflexus sp.]|uniref:hypothetical protein n=1 Tax=Roseiflexus sp. TaxID=2562120 RepID=UPI0021DDEEDB|nr:hypothetical protein [Roseiflexus sp.]GIW03088.1 MAG: hypothetical protein KatS3mg058_4491 [Roseiflexus sp.]
MRSRLLLVTTLLAGAISVAGCGNLPSLSQGNPQPTASPGASSGGAAPPAAQPTPAAAQPIQAPANTPAQTIPTAPQTGGAPSTPATGDGAPAIPLPQIQANLAQLESYRITVVSKMNGKTTDGKTIESQMTYTQALHRPSKTGYTLVVENRQGAPSTQSELYNVGDMLYIYQRQDGKELCQPRMMAGMGDMLRGTADAMTDPLTGTAQLVNRGETVNGVLTDRYTLDQETINQFGATVEKADLWVARDGGYPVKYDLTINVTSNATGWAAMLGGGAPVSEGTIVYNWSLEDINKTTITLPSACSGQTVGVDLPLPAGTQVDMMMPNTTMGKVNAGIDSVLTFFKTEYPKLGYELTDEYGDAQNGYILNFKKGADEVMVQFSTMSDGSVQITLTRG